MRVLVAFGGQKIRKSGKSRFQIIQALVKPGTFFTDCAFYVDQLRSTTRKPCTCNCSNLHRALESILKGDDADQKLRDIPEDGGVAESGLTEEIHIRRKTTRRGKQQDLLAEWRWFFVSISWRSCVFCCTIGLIGDFSLVRNKGLLNLVKIMYDNYLTKSSGIYWGCVLIFSVKDLYHTCAKTYCTLFHDCFSYVVGYIWVFVLCLAGIIVICI